LGEKDMKEIANHIQGFMRISLMRFFQLRFSTSILDFVVGCGVEAGVGVGGCNFEAI
jgi:hypothetical protein